MHVLDVVLFVVAAVIGVAVGVWCQKDADAPAMRDLARYKATFLQRQGCTTMLGDEAVNYNFLSLDGGKSWWDIETKEDGAVIVHGPADPAVLEHLRAMDELFAHGPLDLQNPEDRELAKRAGFEVNPAQQ